MPVTIEKGVPLPGRAFKSEYPFAQMEVNDSFLVPGVKSVATKNAAAQTGFKFKTKKVDGGCRVWRVA